MLIGLYSPYPQAGKSTLAEHLSQKEKFIRIKMAGALKHMLAAFFEYVGIEESFVPNYLEGALKEYPCPLLGGNTPRHAMQTLGTEWGRGCISEDFWVDTAERVIRDLLAQGDSVVVDDVRFPNEMQMIKRNGGIAVKIIRPDAAPKTQILHASEGSLNDMPFDFTIENTYTTSEDFAEHAVKIIYQGVAHHV